MGYYSGEACRSGEARINAIFCSDPFDSQWYTDPHLRILCLIYTISSLVCLIDYIGRSKIALASLLNEAILSLASLTSKLNSIVFNTLAFFKDFNFKNSTKASSAGEANSAKFIFEMAFYADIKRERPQYGCGL